MGALVQGGIREERSITEPLLNPEVRRAETNIASHEIRRVTPLPKLQVALIAVAYLSEAVTVSFIYPFINERLSEMSSTPKELARRSGLLFACCAATQFISTYFWGTLSDRVGRKPILLVCFLICAISTVGFGAGTTFLEILIFRTLTGTSYGDVPALRSAIADVTDSTNQARAFSFLVLSWTVGSAFSPLIGGFLSHPEKLFPGVFGSSTYFTRHPYALPCFTVAGISFLLFLLIAFFLEETLRPQQHKGTSLTPSTANVPPHSIPGYGSTDVSGPQNGDTFPTTSDLSAEALGPDTSTRLSVLQILGDPLVRNVLISYGFLALTSASNDIIFALWMFLPIDDGGLGFSPSQIAAIISIGNILGAFVTTTLFPWLHHRFGTLPIYRCAIGLDVLFVMLYPIVHALAAGPAVQRPRDAGDIPLNDGIWSNVAFPVLVGIGLMLTIKGFSVLAFGGSMVLVTASAPSPRSLGAVNSLSLMTASFGRSIGPPLYTNIFAISMGGSGHGLIWIFMSAMVLLSLLASFRAKEGHKEWRRSIG